MLRFRVRAETAFGDTIVLVGAGEALGDWDPANGVAMTTEAKDYPLWTSSPRHWKSGQPLEYKYVRRTADGQSEWEADGENRSLPAQLKREAEQANGQLEDMIIDDGTFGQIRISDFCFPAAANLSRPASYFDVDGAPNAPLLVILGDAAAAGLGAWRFDGWAPQLGRALRSRFGYSCRNVSEVGITARKALQDFDDRVRSLRPTVVLLSFGLEMEPLATCPDHGRAGLCTDFLQTLEGLVQKVWDIGAFPVVGGLYPHAQYAAEHAQILRQTEDKVRQLGVPVLDWLSALSGQDCTWADGLASEPAMPNTAGHARIFDAVSRSHLATFEPSRVAKEVARRAASLDVDKVCFDDKNGFVVKYSAARGELLVSNGTKSDYTLSRGWGALQDALAAARREAPWALRRGLYVAYGKEAAADPLVSVSLDITGRLVSDAAVAAGRTLSLLHAPLLRKASGMRELFYDGNLGLLQAADGNLYILNEAECEYNVHPMWQAVRLATRVLEEGIYEDGSNQPFRTAVISTHGLQSRVKVPAGSAVRMRRMGPLSSIKRIAVLPLGDRCSVRMLLHKIEYDGPCYPFDLTRTTSLADVADMVSSGFSEMWYQELLEYRHEEGRIFHRKWGGLSFAHEVDEGDDPISDFGAIAARMAKRYAGRAARFDFACNNADEVLFVRTGVASRGEVTDLLSKMSARYPGVHAKLLLISDQPTEEFQGLMGVKHVREHFDPDRMYEDMSYWIHCAHRFRGILDEQGINPRTLYWCPNNLQEAEREMKEAASKVAAASPSTTAGAAPKSQASAPEQPPLVAGLDASPAKVALLSRVDKFSHSNLFALDHGHLAVGDPVQGA